MASSRVETQITWDTGSTSKSLTANNTRYTSDVVTLNVEDWDADLILNADNAGTPASGDVIAFYLHYSAGDINADATDDYATDEHAELLCVLDTYATNTPGEDPASRVVPIRCTAGKFKVSCTAPQAASRNITARARLVTHRGQ